MTTPTPSPTAPTKADLEEGVVLSPRYDAAGLVTAIAQDAATGEILMLAHMNAEALRLTLETGIAHYWSRSRHTLWKKGETSGQLQSVMDIRVDCDQDAVLMKVAVAGNGGACHTGRRSCFYRRVVLAGGTPHLVHVAAADDTDGA
jgi:phosphoribosyl-AMP cyclohydrolase